ncbi:hypothetical protein SPAN111604_09135 [Sphingomonas antarctica]|uniref:winged helix-turn-helix domain-containing tetratricopeptide repeat protein n=1 Tax=Sphingomonas antarctica TaxID=2040274 RepID=UPI0039ED2F21
MDTAATPPRLAFDRFVFDPADARLSGPDGPIRIGNKALGVLAALIAARGRLLTKDELFETVWDGTVVSESALTSVIKELRRALGDDRQDARFIESVYGRGYRFLPEVREAGVDSAPPPRPKAPLVDAPTLAAAPRRKWLWPVALAMLVIAIGIAAWRFVPRSTADVDLASSSVAVLPFANISGDKDEDYFAAGVTEELRTRLSRLASLQVAARASSVSVKTSGLDAQAIGKRLAVGYVIDGSVRREGNIVRVSATLVDTRTGFQRWTQSYDRKLDDVFAIQGDIAQSVASAVQGRLGKAQAAVLDASLTSVPAAFDAYAKGRALFDLSGDEATYRAALAAFDRAIELDPKYAAAYAQRSRVLVTLANQFASTDKLRGIYAESLRSAQTGVALSPDLDVAQAALGYVLVNGFLDFARAAKPYERAIHLGPNNADILIPYGLFAARTQGEQGLVSLYKAATLDPLSARPFLSLGAAFMSLHRYADAIPQFSHALKITPGLTSGHSGLGDALLMLGRPKEARAQYIAEPLDFTRLAGLAITERQLRNNTAAQAAFDELSKQGDAVAYQRAQVLAQWGNSKGALDALEAAFRVGDAGLVKMRSDPLLMPINRQPRFVALLAKIHFPS